MKELKLYSVSDQYISYLRNFKELKRIFDNKENQRIHTRKYLGVVLTVKQFHYYIPFSSPKDSDYFIDSKGNKVIRKSTPTIIRMTSNDSNDIELLGTLKISNMIPVPKSELILYTPEKEKDTKYRDLVRKQISFIRKNKSDIIKNATLVYKQKINSQNPNNPNLQFPKYLAAVLPFTFAESKCLKYIASTESNC